MAPLTRLRVGLIRMFLEAVALCFAIGCILIGSTFIAVILVAVVAVLRLLHVAAGVAGYLSLSSSVRKAANRG